MTNIVIEAKSGLCNRLRVVFSHYQYARSVNSKLTVIWVKNSACPGCFLDYFEPVENIEFVSKPPKKKIYYSGNGCHPKYNPGCCGQGKITCKMYLYGKLELLPDLKKTIAEKKSLLEDRYVAVHIRRTDHVRLAKRKSTYTADKEFLNFIDKNKTRNLYIATDNKKTYDQLFSKYGKLVKFKYHSTTGDLRETTLRDAIVDLYMCTYADQFMGTTYSSFTETIHQMRKFKECKSIT